MGDMTTRKFALWLIPSSGQRPQLLSMIQALASKHGLPHTTAVLGLALAVELREPNVMKRPPRSPGSAILSSELMIRILIVGIVILIGAFGLYEWELSRGAGVAAARTVAVNAVIAIEVLYLFNCRSLTQSMFRLGLFSNRWVVVGIGAMGLLQVLFTYVPAMNHFLTSAPIDLAAWGRILAAGLIGYLIVEFEKWLRRLRGAA